MTEVHFETPEDVHMYVQALVKRRVEDIPAVRAWRFAERVTYLYALVGAYLFYYLLDAMTQAISLPSIVFTNVNHSASRFTTGWLSIINYV